MFLGINMFLALLRAHFNPRYARAKMILSRAKNIVMPANVNSIIISYSIKHRINQIIYWSYDRSNVSYIIKRIINRSIDLLLLSLGTRRVMTWSYPDSVRVISRSVFCTMCVVTEKGQH